MIGYILAFLAGGIAGIALTALAAADRSEDEPETPRWCKHAGEPCCYPDAPCSTCPEEHGLFDRMEADDDG